MSKQELKENDICRVVDIAKCDGYYPIKEHFIGKKVRYSEIMPEEKSVNVKEMLRLFKNASSR